MNEKELKVAWQAFTKDNDFKMNPDAEHVNMIAKGVLINEQKHGLKLCPCRLRNGTFDRDLELICPCNFKTHETWESKGMCWCGLFVKK